MRCARSTFITAKITVLHQWIYPKRYCETRSLLFNPHTSLFSTYFYNTAYGTILRSVMQTHISDSYRYITVTHGSCFENEGAKNSRDSYCTPSNILNIPESCRLMKHCCSATFWHKHKLATRVTLPYPAFFLYMHI